MNLHLLEVPRGIMFVYASICEAFDSPFSARGCGAKPGQNFRPTSPNFGTLDGLKLLDKCTPPANETVDGKKALTV